MECGGLGVLGRYAQDPAEEGLRDVYARVPLAYHRIARGWKSIHRLVIRTTAVFTFSNLILYFCVL